MVRHEILTQNAIHGGITEGDLLQAISMFKDFFLGCYYHLKELKALIDDGLHKSDLGVMFDILCLKTSYKIADIKAAMIFKLFDTIHMWKCHIKLSAINAAGPHMTIRDINKVAMKAFDQKINWSFVKNGVLDSCAKQKVSDKCPDLTVNTAPEAVNLLEVLDYCIIYVETSF